MASAKFKFYVNAILKELVFANLLQRDSNFDIVDIDANKYFPRTPSSDIELNIAGGLWFKEVDAEEIDEPNVLEMYYGELLIVRIDRDTGNIIYGFGDINLLPIEKGGTNATTVSDARANLGLGTAALRNVGLAVGNLVEVLADGKLPTLDASNLTNLPLLPAGSVIYFASDVIPAGANLLVADGSLILRASYPNLFANIGDRFGAGDGSTTFRTPDLRGVFLRGIDNGRGLDPGRVFGSYQADSFAAHSHVQRAGGNGGNHGGSLWGNIAVAAGNTSTVGGTETRGKNVALLPLIAY